MWFTLVARVREGGPVSPRPLLPADVPQARDVQWAAMSDLNARCGETDPELTPLVRQRGEARIAHLQRTDPASAWVTESQGRVTGCSMALVREGMWFLSLLMVDPSYQGRGLGKELLDAALRTATQRSWILATADPAALRRYQRAGFSLHPSFVAKGPVDRALLPKVEGVRPGDFARDGEQLDEIVRSCRGAGLTQDLEFLAGGPMQLHLVDGEGFVVLRDGVLAWLGATNEGAARRLLWTAIAEAGETAEVDWLAADQQWGIDVCLEAHLALGWDATLCFRGQPPVPTYLPNGALG